MRILIGLICLIGICNSAHAQVKLLQDYIEEGRSYSEICAKAEKLIRKNKLEDENYRETIFRKKRKKKDFLDDDKLKFERWKWFWRDRVTEDGKFPDLQRQWQLYNQITHESNNLFRNAPSWKHEGPVRNSGGYWGMGRTTHIAFHPNQLNTFFVASPNGGLWKTTNNGVSYSSIGDNLPYQPVGIVLIDPQAPNTLYVSLGEKDGWWQYNLGIYKTTDGGVNWKPTTLNWKLTDNKVIYALEMNPQNSSILIAATNDGIYKTFNGGNSWTKIRPENFSDVKYKPGDTSIVYAALNDYWGNCNVFKSIDGGNVFSQATDFGLQKAFFRLTTTVDDPEYIGINMSVDGAKKFYLSKNSGMDFNYVSDMPENTVLYFSQQNKSILYCGYVVIYKSTDEGKTWKQITDWWNSGQGYPEIHADHHFIACNPKLKNELYFCCDGGLYRYYETTQSWDELVNGLAITQFYKLGVSTSIPPVMIGGSQDNGGWLKRANGSWSNTNGGDAMSQVIDPTNQNIAYTEYWGGNAVYRTTNGFNDLDEITQNIGAELPGQWVTPFSLNPQNPKTFIIGYNDVFVSFNRGNSFTKLSNNLTGNKDNDLREIKISPVDTNLLIGFRANTMYISKDFGKTWKNSSLITNLEITGIEFHAKDSNRIWCTRGGYGAVKVMSSKDKGNSWTNITKNFVNTPVSCIAYDEASNALFVGTDFGVFFSDADNIDWQYYGIGLPHTAVTDLKIHQTQRKLYISTFGRGFYSIDLPDCAPAVVNLEVAVNKKNFEKTDSIKICAGSNILLKAQDSLKGSFRWRGPGGIDTTVFNSSKIDLGSFNTIQKSGNYSLEYTSDKGCKRLDTLYVRVLIKPNLVINQSYKYLDCNHESIILTPNLPIDTINYAYHWTNSKGLDTMAYSIQVNQEGNYQLELINKAGNCPFYFEVNISKANPPVIVSREIENNKCFGDSLGSLSISDLAVQPSRYLWSNGDSSKISKHLKAGIYYLTISDANDCKTVDTFLISEPEELILNITVLNSNGMDGSIVATAKGGIAPYKYTFFQNGQIISLNSEIKNLAPGVYDLEVEDANGCKVSREKIVVDQVVENANLTKSMIQVYPNPVNEFLNIQFGREIVETPSMLIINSSGQLCTVNVKHKTNKDLVLDVSQLIAGEYILKLSVFEKQHEFRFTKLK